jgi:hypothetical protein
VASVKIETKVGESVEMASENVLSNGFMGRTVSSSEDGIGP